MGISQEDGRMEGWLYLIRSNPLGLQYSRKRYFVLEDNSLNCFKSPPNSKKEDPIRRALIDSCIRVTDNGRENIHRNVFFIFTLYNASNHNEQLKLGATSSEEAASWIRSLMEATLKECPNKGENIVTHSKKRWPSLRLSRSKQRSRLDSIDWTAFLSMHSDPLASDVIAPSPWTIFGCKNGLRLFKEAKEGDSQGKHWDDHPAIMAVGVVDASSEAIFQTIMSLGASRSEWDFCFSEGSVVEHLDGHSDIIHKKLNRDWLPWGMKRRDLLLRRYWRREDDGTYVILYHSVFHKRCRPERGYIRACLKSGGYVISPVKEGKQSVVKHMLAIDWKFWKSYLFTSSAKHITIQMLGRVAALREFFRAKLGNYPGSDLSSDELTREIQLPQNGKDNIEVEVGDGSRNTNSEESQKSPARHANACGSFLQLNDATDEFFDFLDESEYDLSETLWPSDPGMQSQDHRHPKLSTAAVFVRRLHDLAVQKRGYTDLQEASMSDTVPCSYGATLLKDPSCTVPCSWTAADPPTFLIRSETYLQDRHKIKAAGTLMQMVAADWLHSDKREDDLGGRPGGIVQKYAAQGGGEFFFIVHIQVPGSTTYSLALYYMMDTPVENVPLLHNFVRGDDAYRNSRFKLIPYISKGSWIVKQSVGKKACLVGQALEIHYFRGKNYLEGMALSNRLKLWHGVIVIHFVLLSLNFIPGFLESGFHTVAIAVVQHKLHAERRNKSSLAKLGIDIGSSTVARGVVSLVLGYLNNLVIEMAFLIQGNTEEELPEFLLGTCRLNHLDASKSVEISPWQY